MQAFYNKYFDTIVVVDNQDVYIYKSVTGKAVAVHENLFKDLESHVIDACLDKHSRKLYCSSDRGAFKVINIKNGVELASVDLNAQERHLKFAEGEKPTDSDSFGSEVNEETQRKALIQSQLVWEESVDLKQVISCDKESFSVFDDSGNSPKLIRKVRGAH